MRLSTISLSLVIASLVAIPAPAPLAAQDLVFADFPASAVIRGENVWLRDEPARDPRILAYLQRGDPITVTGEAIDAEGETFYPVEALDSGETGWIRDLFIDPGSIDTTLVIAAPEPEPAEEPEPDIVVVDEPEPEPAATEEPTEVLTFSGDGPFVTDPFTAPSDMLLVTASHEGDARFRVFAIDEALGINERLFNERGSFEGETTFEVDPDAELVLDVEANGPWEITIEPAP
jgi:hypothetical protein